MDLNDFCFLCSRTTVTTSYNRLNCGTALDVKTLFIYNTQIPSSIRKYWHVYGEGVFMRQINKMSNVSSGYMFSYLRRYMPLNRA